MRDDRAVFAALAPTVLRTQPVAWAGARASSKGSMLQRDGAVSRLAGMDGRVHAQVLDGEQVEHVTLAAAGDRLFATCTCEAAPCGHAVAVLLDLQRKMRQTQQQTEQRAMVMGAVRDRLAGVRAVPPEQAPARMLSDLERLPVDAAIDMVALAWRHGLKPSLMETSQLTAATQRLESIVPAEPAHAAQLAVRLLEALDTRKVVFVALPEAAETAVVRLVGVAVATAGQGPVPQNSLETLVRIALDGHLQTAAHAAAGLDVAAQRTPEVLRTVTDLALAWSAQPHSEWREVSAPSGRDRLFSGLVAAWTAAAELDQALTVARAWPPTRGALVVLAQALGTQGRVEDVLTLAAPYDPRGESWAACMTAAAQAAQAQGQSLCAARLASYAFDRRPAEPWFALLAQVAPRADWPARRTAAVVRLLADDDPPWLAGRLAAEPDAAVALLHAVLTAPLRDRTAHTGLTLLRDLDPHGAFQGRCTRLCAMATSPGLTARAFRDELTQLERDADTLGEPGLLRDFARLLARECSDRAPLVTAVRSILGS